MVQRCRALSMRCSRGAVLEFSCNCCFSWSFLTKRINGIALSIRIKGTVSSKNESAANGLTWRYLSWPPTTSHLLRDTLEFALNNVDQPTFHVDYILFDSISSDIDSPIYCGGTFHCVSVSPNHHRPFNLTRILSTILGRSTSIVGHDGIISTMTPVQYDRSCHPLSVHQRSQYGLLTTMCWPISPGQLASNPVWLILLLVYSILVP